MKQVLSKILLLLMFAMQLQNAYAVQRFPRPEFESGYTQPQMLQPSARSDILAALDLTVLIITLSVITWIVLKKRSRKGVFWVSLFSLGYFGFYRQGCVCPIGAIQNIGLGLSDHSYVVPLTVVAFFILPLLFTLFFGRTFCAGVCPFGVIQDLVVIKPQKLGSPLNTVLGMIPCIYLSLAILYAATGTDFIICRYDPFVGIFRFNATFGMFLFAGILLASGVFIARPYCRFLCPYGVLLNWISRFSRRHITITPSNCIQCRLCEDSCPFETINLPVPAKNPESKSSVAKKLFLICLLIPVLVLAGGWIGSRVHETLARVNPKVRLAIEIMHPANLKDQPETYEIKAFRSSGKPVSQLFSEASLILGKFYTGGWIIGGFIGLVFGMTIAGRLMITYRTDYTPNKATCFSCTRCVEYCPIKS